MGRFYYRGRINPGMKTSRLLFLKVCDRTTSPQWNEAFCLPVRDPREDVLIVKVRLTVTLEHVSHVRACTVNLHVCSPLLLPQLSHSWTLPVGSLVVPVKQLLSEPDLILDQWLHLDGASPESQILLRAELKVLQLTSPPPFPSL